MPGRSDSDFTLDLEGLAGAGARHATLKVVARIRAWLSGADGRPLGEILDAIEREAKGPTRKVAAVTTDDAP